MPITPGFRSTIAGSLPKPDWLAESKKLWPAWKQEGEAAGVGQCLRRSASVRCRQRWAA